jgi:translation initiation factor 4E
LFKKGIKPIWEDEVNSTGGEFSTTMRKCKKELMSKHWNKLVMKTIGSGFTTYQNVYSSISSRL